MKQKLIKLSDTHYIVVDKQSITNTFEETFKKFEI